MKTSTKIVIGAIISLLLLVGGSAAYLNSMYDTAGQKENVLFANDESMQNTWAMSGNDLKMSGITVKNYGETFIKSLQANADRYKNDQGAMMKWVQEAKSQMSPDLHRDFMKKIGKVFAEKKAVQLSKISVVQDYRDYIHFSIKGKLTKVFFNYPTAKAQTIMDRIITNKQTKETWKTGEDEIQDPFAS